MKRIRMELCQLHVRLARESACEMLKNGGPRLHCRRSCRDKTPWHKDTFCMQLCNLRQVMSLAPPLSEPVRQPQPLSIPYRGWWFVTGLAGMAVEETLRARVYMSPQCRYTLFCGNRHNDSDQGFQHRCLVGHSRSWREDTVVIHTPVLMVGGDFSVFLLSLCPSHSQCTAVSTRELSSLWEGRKVSAATT